MRRPHGSIQPHGDGFRLWLSRTLPSGKRVRFSKVVHVSDERAAERELAKFTGQMLTRTRRPSRTGRTVSDLVEEWFALAPAEPNTVAEWRGAWRRHGEKPLGRLGIGNLTTYQLDQLYRGLTPAVARKLHVALRLAFAQAIRWGWLEENPVIGATPPKTVAPTIDPPSPEEVALLIKEGNEHGLLVALAAETGLRRGETCGLRWSDLDLDNLALTVQRVVVLVDHQPIVREYPKTAASRRRIGLSPGLARALAARGRTGDWVFGTAAVPLNPEVASRRFARLAARCGVNCRLHDLRHFMVTQALAAGFDWRTIATRGGWSNPAVLMQRYAHFVPERDQDLALHLGHLTSGPEVKDGDNDQEHGGGEREAHEQGDDDVHAALPDADASTRQT